MSMMVMLIWLLLALCSIYAAIAGGTAGRIGAALIIAATVVTYLVQGSERWSQTNIPVMLVDLALMAAFYALALKSNVYWPIWAAGFHLITITGHAATFIVPDFRSSFYYYFNGMWALFVQMSMVLGITLDRNAMRQTG